jgi:predicted nucleotidyltransferase
MLKSAIIKALKVIDQKLRDKKIKWVLVGSTSLALQGVKIRPKDIDILTNKKGAFKINKLLKEYEVEPVKLKWWKLKNQKILEYFGKFKIEGINVEILANRILGKKQKFLKRELFFRKFIKFNGMKLSVAPLEEEVKVYSQLGRKKDLLRIKKIKEILEKRYLRICAIVQMIKR